jgi:predicted DsbA family dithiol-disulfide isomerase
MVGQTMTQAKTTIRIDIVSDIVCPWCYLGKARLDRALATMPDVDAEIHWRPYQLDPTIPRTGVERKAYMEAKFDAIEVSPNTINAHRLIRWADQAGPGIQEKLVDRLFKLYFTEGADIGSSAVLVKAAKETGMDPAIVETLLPTEAEVAGVEGEIDVARKIGVTGVPFFIFNQKYAVSGAQTPEILIEAMRNAVTAEAAPVVAS